MRLLRSGCRRIAVLAASGLMTVLVTPYAQAATPGATAASTNTGRDVGGYWATSFEPGTARPAGFPADGAAAHVRGETAEVNSTVQDVTSGFANGASPTENVASLADGDGSTKWYAAGSGRPSVDHPVSAVYTLKKAAAVTTYSLTSGNDAPPRDPADWTVLGSNSVAAAHDADDPSWTVLDTQEDRRFEGRGQTEFQGIGHPAAYRYYQLRVTGNCAERCAGSAGDATKFQLADWTLRSSAGAAAAPLGVSVEDARSVGAAEGSAALRYAGRVLGRGHAHSRVVLRSGLDVPVGPGAVFGYAIRPADAASAHAAVDVVYTDARGRHVRRLTALRALRDGAGRPLGAAAHGTSLTPGVWNRVTVDLGSLAGARVRAVLLDYDDPAASAGATVSGWVDDIRLGRAAVTSAAAWSYLDAAGVDPAAGAADRTAWTRTGAATAGVPWKSAAGPFGVKGDGTDLGGGFPVTTKLALRKDDGSGDDIEAYFFRTSFTLGRATLDTLTGLVGSVVFDDTATVYVNGRRVAGWNDDGVTRNLQYQTPGGSSGAGDPVRRSFAVPVSGLVAGVNTVAVEVHQCNGTSSDAYFALPELAQTSDSLPFEAARLGTSYASDTLPVPPGGGDYFTWALRSFTEAANTPSVMGPNAVLPSGTTYDQLTALDDKVVADINNAPEDATDPQVREALIDGAGSPYRTMADGLGATVGRLYTQALRNGELPKTQALLSGRVEHTATSSADWYQTAKNTYRYKRPFVRMGFTGDGGLIKQWDSAGGYAGLAGDGSFPSGHTSHAYAQGIVLATLLPRLAPQILARTADYADNRILLAFHYPTDIMGGRMVGENTAQLRWSDPEFRALLKDAKAELETVLTRKCREAGAGDTLARCVDGQRPYLPTSRALSVYHQRLTYGFPRIGAGDAPARVPAGAEDLLLTSFPHLTDAQRRTVLAATGLPSGHVLDEEGDGGSWQRLDLAAAMAAKVTVAGPHRHLVVNGVPVDVQGRPLRR
ncbi:phosphatase PAP2 family protein [Streptomyces sp. NPDC005435]|uniref:acid phosphatase n=1 Tax=Streptomyces sp. NPDC005435 TaxID=3154464 RepID=UPI0034516E76